jgi:prepilin-type N-terminal cleavage/methylation domain-containing protein
MVQTNINAKRRDSGFTIVELLVVIVVIAILAAITIVSYTGVTAKANLSKTQSNVGSVGQVIDAMGAENGVYPANAAAVMTGGTYAKVPAGLTVDATAASSTNATTHFQYSWCGASAATANGARLQHYDGSTTQYTYYGAASGSSSCTAA